MPVSSGRERVTPTEDALFNLTCPSLSNSNSTCNSTVKLHGPSPGYAEQPRIVGGIEAKGMSKRQTGLLGHLSHQRAWLNNGSRSPVRPGSHSVTTSIATHWAHHTSEDTEGKKRVAKRHDLVHSIKANGLNWHRFFRGGIRSQRTVQICKWRCCRSMVAEAGLENRLSVAGGSLAMSRVKLHGGSLFIRCSSRLNVTVFRRHTRKRRNDSKFSPSLSFPIAFVSICRMRSRLT